MSKNLVWKLLRHHISIPQFAGFVLANLIGMTIVLLGFQFYRDVVPVLTADDGLLQSDYVIVSKKVGTGQMLSQRSLNFSESEIEELASQPFASGVGRFTSAEFKVDASMSIDGKQVLHSELPIESVDLLQRDLFAGFAESDSIIPIVLPRSYIAMYNFGFAQGRSLPKVSEGLIGMIDFDLLLRGNGRQESYKGKVVAFTSRLNSILVPQSFMESANRRFAPDATAAPTRLIMTTGDLAKENVSQFMEDHGYEVEDDRLNTEKTTFFLRLMISVVMAIGFVISLLSFYILMLSIYLLVEKNSEKMQNLLLIGYRPSEVARPYQLLTVGLNVCVLALALLVVFLLRRYYMGMVQALFPTASQATMLPAVGLGLLLLLLVSLLNIWVIRRKIVRIWHGKERM